MKFLTLVLLVMAPAAQAHDAEIVKAVGSGADGKYGFSVTLTHPETGWDDYADGWRVELEDGTVLGTRVLVHPHVNEQPFTRSLSGVAVPSGTNQVFIRAKTLVDGWSDSTLAVPLN